MPPHTRLLDAVGNLRDSLHRPAWNPLLLPSCEWNVAAWGMCSLEALRGKALVETRTLKAGDGFQIPPETPHAGGKPGNAKSRVLITYVVQKGKPLASPA